jgi:hypothetical protein
MQLLRSCDVANHRGIGGVLLHVGQRSLSERLSVASIAGVVNPRLSVLVLRGLSLLELLLQQCRGEEISRIEKSNNLVSR